MITWSYGGGVQTAAIAVLILQNRLPIPDIAIIADTTRELSSTWEYLDTVVQPALDKIGLQILIASHEFADVDIYNGRQVLIPAFTENRQTGETTRMPTFCSLEWKRDAINRCLRAMGINKTDMWLGISMDEVERMKPSAVDWVRVVFPLIEMIPLDRKECIALVEDFGWPTPPRSRCWMCPNQSSKMWLEMAEELPEEFDKAVQFEQEIQLLAPNVFLHRSLHPLDEAILGSEEELLDSCDSGYCYT